MALGILLVFASLALNVAMLIDPKPFTGNISSAIVFALIASVCLAVFVFLVIQSLQLDTFIIVGFVVCAFLILFALLHRRLKQERAADENNAVSFIESFGFVARLDNLDVISVALWLLLALATFSNSYVVNEDGVTSFLLQSVVVLQVLVTWRHLVSRNGDTKPSNARRTRIVNKIDLDPTSPPVLVLLLGVGCCAFPRLASMFRVCREEQWTCVPSSLFLLLPAQNGNYSPLRFLFAALSLSLPVYGVYRWLRYHGNLNGSSPCVRVVTYCVPSCVGCVCTYWIIQHIDTSPLVMTIGLPRGLYFLTLVSVVIAAIDPLTTFILPPRNDTSIDIPRIPLGSEQIVPHIYQHIRANWKVHMKNPGAKNISNKNEMPIIYGLATVYSSCHLIVLVLVSIMMTMLLGDRLAPSVALLWAALFALLELHSGRVRASRMQGEYLTYC